MTSFGKPCILLTEQAFPVRDALPARQDQNPRAETNIVHDAYGTVSQELAWCQLISGPHLVPTLCRLCAKGWGEVYRRGK